MGGGGKGDGGWEVVGRGVGVGGGGERGGGYQMTYLHWKKRWWILDRDASFK